MVVAAGKSKGPKVRIFAEYLVYLVFRFLEEVFCRIPRDETAMAAGRFCGRIMFVLGGERRKVAVENLTLAFGAERTAEEIRSIARRNFEHLAMLGVEFFRLRRWDQAKLAEKLVFDGCTNFNEAWLPGSDGVLYITAHIGCFEVLAAASRFLGIKGNLIVTPAPNRFVNDRMFFKRGGEESGLNILPHKGVVRKALNLLESGEMVVVLADQRGDDTRPVWVSFFGRRVLANGVFAKLAVEGNARVQSLVALRREDGRYTCAFGEEIPIQVTADRQGDVTVNSQRFHDVFERWLKEYPEQGFWMHRKFKRKERGRSKERSRYLIASRA